MIRTAIVTSPAAETSSRTIHTTGLLASPVAGTSGVLPEYSPGSVGVGGVGGVGFCAL